MKAQAQQDIDRNHKVIGSNEAFKESKAVAFTGAAGLGAQGTVSLFTVTGTVLMSLFAVCSENLAGASATIEVGISGNTAALLAQTTATDIDSGEVWIDNAPATVEALPSSRILAAGTDVIATVATADITDGTLTFYALWRPLSDDGLVEAA
jgi:hypothetical protein